MTTLAQYSAARAALAEAARVDQVMHVRDEVEHLKLYSRQIKDRTLMADALELQLRCERRLGELLTAAKDLGQISRGQPKKNCADEEQYSRVRLEDAGIDRKLSSKAQKVAKLSDRAFAAMVEQSRNRIAGIAAAPVNCVKKKQPTPAEIPSDLQHVDDAPTWHQQCLSAVGILKRAIGTAPDIGAAAWLKFLITDLVKPAMLAVTSATRTFAEIEATERIDEETGEVTSATVIADPDLNTNEAAPIVAGVAAEGEEGATQSSSNVSSSQPNSVPEADGIIPPLPDFLDRRAKVS